MNKILFIIIITIATILFFLVDAILTIRCIIIIKQVIYKENLPLIEDKIIPNFFEKIKNKYIRIFLNFVGFSFIVNTLFLYYLRYFFYINFSFEYYLKFLLLTFIMTFIMFILFLIIKKLKIINVKIERFYILELILITFLIISSIHCFYIFFEWFTRQVPSF